MFLARHNFLKARVQSQPGQLPKDPGPHTLEQVKGNRCVSYNSPIAITYLVVCGTSKFPLRQITILKGVKRTISYPICPKSTQPYLTVVDCCMVTMKWRLSFFITMMPTAVFASLQLLTQFRNLIKEKFTLYFTRYIQVHTQFHQFIPPLC